MNNNSLSVIILAAGKGTRMNSEIPKVLHEINGTPMIKEVINTSNQLNPIKIIAVIGYKKDLIIKKLENLDVEFAVQKEQKGTAHAVQQCEKQLENIDCDVLVLSGDVPLIKKETLQLLIRKHQENHSKASLISTVFSNPSGYGRIVRDNENNFIKIVEHKDANKNQLQINEINSGIYIFNSKILFEKIHLIENKNYQKEYYLTDIFNYIDKNEISVLFTQNSTEISGVNTIEQLMEINEK